VYRAARAFSIASGLMSLARTSSLLTKGAGERSATSSANV
jgi:hypothetical protein